MSEEHTRQHGHVLAFAGLAVVVLAAIAVRASIQFGTSLMPGMNGAYYLVQVRAVIEEGHLAEHDMPLIFWLQAGLARLVQALSTLTLDSSIVLASKLFDSIVPALAAIPAFLMAVRWPGPARPAMAPLIIANRSAVWRGLRADWSVCGSSQITMVGRTLVPSGRAQRAPRMLPVRPDTRMMAPLEGLLGIVGMMISSTPHSMRVGTP